MSVSLISGTPKNHFLKTTFLFCVKFRQIFGIHKTRFLFSFLGTGGPRFDSRLRNIFWHLSNLSLMPYMDLVCVRTSSPKPKCVQVQMDGLDPEKDWSGSYLLYSRANHFNKNHVRTIQKETLAGPTFKNVLNCIWLEL